MQQELKHEAFRVEAVRKSVESTCFDRCIPAPSGAVAVLAKALPERVPGLSPEMTEIDKRTRYDLSGEEATCMDRCAWKYMLTAKICLATLNKSKNVKDPHQQGPKM